MTIMRSSPSTRRCNTSARRFSYSRRKNKTPDFALQRPIKWPSVEEITAKAPLPSGYRYQYLDRQQVPTLITALKAWYPGIAVGNASCHLRESFYAEKVCLDGELDRDLLVVTFRRDDELVGV